MPTPLRCLIVLFFCSKTVNWLLVPIYYPTIWIVPQSGHKMFDQELQDHFEHV